MADDYTGRDKKQINPQESRKHIIQRCIASLEHACQCRDANCRIPSCQKMKRVVSHAKTCKRKGNGSCAICKQLSALTCNHAKNCQENKCPVPFCLNIKYKLKQQRMSQLQILKRCIATTQNRMTEAMKHSSPGSSSQTSQPSPESKPLTSQQLHSQVMVTRTHGPGSMQPRSNQQFLQQLLTALKSSKLRQQKSQVLHILKTNPRLMAAFIKQRYGQPPQQQQHMDKPMPQMLPGQPNRMMGVRNMGNWDNSNFNQNIQLQGAQPGKPMGLRSQAQMMGPNNMPNPAEPLSGHGDPWNIGSRIREAMVESASLAATADFPQVLKLPPSEVAGSVHPENQPIASSCIHQTEVWPIATTTTGQLMLKLGNKLGALELGVD